MHQKLWIWMVAAVWMATGCGGGNNAGPPGGVRLPSGTVANLAQGLAKARCDAWHMCLGGAVEVFLNGEVCEVEETRRYENSELGDLQAGVSSGRIMVDQGQVPICLQAMTNWRCLALSSGLPPECEAAIQGTVPIGSPCSHDLECAQDGWCDDSLSCPGICALPKPGGQPCQKDHECMPGLQCDQTCHPPVRLGMPCTGTLGVSQCEHGEVCTGPPGATTCQTLDQLFTVPVGQPCNPMAGQLCAAGASCQANALAGPWTCVAELPPGQPCGLGIPNPCTQGNYCAGLTPVNLNGMCAPLKAAGQPCEQPPVRGLPTGRSCVPYHRCDPITNMCTPMSDVGGPCNTPDECYSGECINRVCRIAHECVM